MKAKELMIGDWVNVSARFLETAEERNATSGSYKLRRENCRVSGLNGDLIAFDKIYSDVFSYEPIPLTEEILKANGWNRFKWNYDWWYEHKNVNFYIHPRSDDGFDICIINDVSYLAFAFKCTSVHRLQHVLRLCELNDLADNFKI